MTQNRDGTSHRLPFLSSVREVADQLLLLRINRDHRSSSSLKVVDPIIDELELIVAIRMIFAFLSLARPLQTVARLVQQLPHLLRTDHVTLILEFFGQLPSAFRCPTQGRLWITAS